MSVKRWVWIKAFLTGLFLSAYGIFVFYVAVNYPLVIGSILASLAFCIDLIAFRYHIFQEEKLYTRLAALIDEPRLTLFLYWSSFLFIAKFNVDLGFISLILLIILHCVIRYIIPNIAKRYKK